MTRHSCGGSLFMNGKCLYCEPDEANRSNRPQRSVSILDHAMASLMSNDDEVITCYSCDNELSDKRLKEYPDATQCGSCEYWEHGVCG